MGGGGALCARHGRCDLIFCGEAPQQRLWVAEANRVVGTVRHLWQAIEKEKTIKASCNRRDGTWEKRAKASSLCTSLFFLAPLPTHAAGDDACTGIARRLYKDRSLTMGRQKRRPTSRRATYHIGGVSRSCRTWYRHRPSDGEREFDPRFLRGERLSWISQPAKKGRPQLPARSRGATSWANNRMELSTQSTGIWPPTFDSMMMPVRPSSSRSCRSRASTMSGVP
jgi:hypothetical protein